MTVTKASAILGVIIGLAVAGWVTAQDDQGFEALLKDITQPAEGQTAPEPAAETSTAPAEIEPAAEAANETELFGEDAAVEAEAEAEVEVESFEEDAAVEAEADTASFEEDTAVEAEAEIESFEEDAAVEAEAEIESFEEDAAVEAEAEVESFEEDTAVEAEAEVESFEEDAAVEAEADTASFEEDTAVEAEAEVESFEEDADVEAVTEVEPAEEQPAEAAQVEDAVEAAPEAVAEVALTPEQEEARVMASQEEVRRQAKEVEGQKGLDSGMKALDAGDYDAAIRDLEQAYINLPDRPAMKKQREHARKTLSAAYYGKANDIFRKNGNLADAKASVEQALQLTPRDKSAATLKKRIVAEEERQVELAMRPVPPKERPGYKQQKKSISDLTVEGKAFYKIADYDSAEAVFESILQRDEYNVDAMRFLRKIDEVRFDIKTKEREATSAELMRDVRDAWNPPIRREVELPASIQTRTQIQTVSTTQKLQEKMEHIIIPAIEFRQANINDVVNFLVEESIKQDTVDNSGVNIILHLAVPGAAAAAPEPNFEENPFGGEAFAADTGVSAAAGTPTITLNLRRISLLDAIRYITEVAQMKFRLEGNAVIITPEGVVSGRVVTRFYPVQPSFLDVIVEKGDAPDKEGDFVEMGSGKATIKKSDVKEFFERAGVPFPAGTSITYNQSISQLIVANTPENLENFERILSRLNVVPNQVEIEARFIEIAQDDLEELGLQWILTDNYEFAQNTGSGAPLGGTQRVQVNADPNGFTKGLRFFNFNRNTGTLEPQPSTLASSGLTPLGGIATIASVLTNPELSVVVQALSMHGGTDLLSAPRVTTRSGVQAQIQVVQEIIYPTEFETTQPQFNDTGNVTTPPVVTPGSFETRETGVILNVTPTVGPDGYTIDLTLVPEVSELVEWIQYGSTLTIPRSSGGEQTFTFNIPQPIFSSRNVTTSIVIWDGQTVVMGGLIREELIRVKDKIPILGDIPVIGRLFRTEGQSSQKRNLLIFVTARLVDPAGKPIHRGEMIGATEVTETAAATGAVQ
ncbi:MAG: hypothetical protein V1929_10650 [bacterium]